MTIAVTTTGATLDAPLDARFGRAPCFIVYDLERNHCTVLDNTPHLDAAQGAGIQAAQAVARAGANAVITGHCGPKAFRVLAAAGITVYTCDAATVQDALARYRAGTLTPLSAADVDGHW
jgi:predicted Fe-Mo cluster-binding NifX family protein